MIVTKILGEPLGKQTPTLFKTREIPTVVSEDYFRWPWRSEQDWTYNGNIIMQVIQNHQKSPTWQCVVYILVMHRTDRNRCSPSVSCLLSLAWNVVQNGNAIIKLSLPKVNLNLFMSYSAGQE